MEYRRLGETGLSVSRICLGCMSYGDPAASVPRLEPLRWEWALREDEARPFFKRALELGINFFDTANVYSFGASEEITGRALQRLRAPRGGRDRHQGVGRDAPGPERRRPLAQGDPPRDRRQPEAARAPTTSTSTRSTAGTRRRRSRRRWRRSTTWCGPARRATWAPRPCTPGSSPRPSTSPRRTAGRASSRCRTTTTSSTARRSARWCRSAATRESGSSPGARSRAATWRGGREAKGTKRSETDRFGKTLYAPMAEADRRVLAALDALARKRKLPHAQIALAWLLAKEAVAAPIVGATKLDHLESAVGALGVRPVRPRRWRRSRRRTCRTRSRASTRLGGPAVRVRGK